jgi:predicted ester cyclase
MTAHGRRFGAPVGAAIFRPGVAEKNPFIDASSRSDPFVSTRRADIAWLARIILVSPRLLSRAGATGMTRDGLSDIYRGYIACLNRQDWSSLGTFVHQHVRYNGEPIGLSGYREMLEGDFRAIPDLFFEMRLLASDPPRIAARLWFDCTPKGLLFGVPVNGRKVQFAENVFYEFAEERIANVWSIIDKAAIAAQLSLPRDGFDTVDLSRKQAEDL